MYEKWRMPLWAAATAKDMEFAATQRSASSFVKEGIAFFDKPTYIVRNTGILCREVP